MMYYTGIDPFSGKAVHVPDAREKILQRALLQYKRPENRAKVREALFVANRADLIGYGEKCLIPPAKSAQKNGTKNERSVDKRKNAATIPPKKGTTTFAIP